MKVRIKFSKYGVVKFIGHLDVMRYFQKANRRAGIDIAYSQGFNPHQIMSFAAPLGVGLTSDGEYVDVDFNVIETEEAIIKSLNAVMNEGFAVTEAKILKEPLPNQKRETAMSLVAAADYLVSLKDGYELKKENGQILDKDEFHKLFDEFYRQNQIVINKKTKKSEKEMDIRPYIFLYGITEEEFLSAGKELKVTNSVNGIEHADTYENGIRVFLCLATGSVINIKPELVMEAFCEKHGIKFEAYAFQYHRMETYANVADHGKTIEEMILAVEQKESYALKLDPLGKVGIM
ncbi:MAG TPA: Fe-S oxidoreductase [Lachnoclostridium phytofermentans]|uniref:Fe-S oxidoreductase n=1 Tax=Lachnoclostridium phytofermentans TaxID=66219 RepID=A0A3D2X1X5_9FIRM|nr:TIGR03936 family radical SAM-associated protein [Lachnoclostridium sp.]HCL00986.1 Fe-S oxidoreductase [Lachnoclostridium phytofermentans]